MEGIDHILDIDNYVIYAQCAVRTWRKTPQSVVSDKKYCNRDIWRIKTYMKV